MESTTAPSRLALEQSLTTQPPISYSTIQAWKGACQSPVPSDDFLARLPKIELHVHIEGTLSSSLLFKLAKKHGLLPIKSKRLNKDFWDEDELEREVYGGLLGVRSVKGKGISAFFEAYYGGMEVLKGEEDFYELAMAYYRRSHASNVRYAEIMFDIQAHTRRGVSVDTVMNGLERAKIAAEKDFGIHSTFIANFLRDLSLEDAEKHYDFLFPKYSHLITGIGLDSNEFGNPPSKFQPLFIRARANGLKLTCHCDVDQPETLNNIEYVATTLGSSSNPTQGGDRIDHGLDCAQSEQLVAEIARRATGMTLCPWAYVRHHSQEKVFGWTRQLLNNGVKVNISSDSPAYVEGNYLMENLRLLRLVGEWNEHDFIAVQRNSVELCWASEELKRRLMDDINKYWEDWHPQLE